MIAHPFLGGAGMACLALSAPAVAATPDPAGDGMEQEITITATRAPVRVLDAPASVSVKSDEEIADELATDIKDLVRFEPGVSVTRQPARFGAALGTTGRAGNEGFTIRGVGGNRVLIQVDGVRVPDGFSFGAQGVGRGDYVDVGLIKSVEILRGPASALYGSDGLAGAVSFITSDPEDILQGDARFGGLARAAYSSADNEFAETLILAGRSGRLSAMAAYTRRDYEELDNKGTNDVAGSARTTPNPQDGRSDALLGRLVWEPGGSHKLRLTGEYVDTRLNANVLSGLSATVLDLRAHDTGNRARAALDWSWSGDGTIESGRLAAYWQQGKDRQFTFEDRQPAADRTRINTFDNRVVGASGEVRLRFGGGEAPSRLVIGGDISSTRQEGLRDGTVPPAGETFPTRAFPVTDYLLAGLFASGEIALAEGAVTLYPALRFDAYDMSPRQNSLPSLDATGQSGSRLSPKFGAVVKLSDAVRLYGNYAQGFKAPEPSQVNQFFENLAFGYTSRPNPDLGPERSESLEAGVRFIGRNTSLSIAAFKSNYKDFIEQIVVDGSFTPADPAVYQFVNLGRVKIKGLESKFEGRTDSGFTGTLAISYATGTEIDETGARSPLMSIDPLKLVAGIGYRAPDGRFGGQLTATHSARKEQDRTAGCTNGCYRPGAFTILDATAFARITENLTLRAGIFNLLDEKYSWWSDGRGLSMARLDPLNPASPLVEPATADAYTQPGRNFSASLSFRF